MSPKPVDLEALSALEAKATPGDWSDDPRGGGVVRGPKLYEYARGSGQRQLASFMLHDDLPPEEREANAALIVALRNAAPAMIQELRRLRVWQEASEKELRLLVAERDSLRAEVEGLKGVLAIIHRDGGHHTEAVGLTQSVNDAHKVWAQLMTDLEAARAQLATAHDALRLFEEGRKLFVDGLDDRAQDRFEQAADAMKTTKGGGA